MFTATATVTKISANTFSMIMLLATTTYAASTTTTKIEENNLSSPGQCVTYVKNNEVLKDIGSVWVLSDNPCQIHSCETDEQTGQPKEVITEEDCSGIKCEKDAELIHQNGLCCGTCVRTKCLHNGIVYEIGETWHNRDDCTILECSQLDVNSGSSGGNGSGSGGNVMQPIISVYKKSCPSLPSDCPIENIYEKDCCSYCRESIREVSSADSADEAMMMGKDQEVWNEQFYRNHPCVRSCKLNAQPMVCRYTFIVEWYETLSRACYNCPYNLTDCQRPHCIIGDGIRRSVTVVNRMMPGPSIEVCLNDLIIVDVKNHLLGESTTIHWHGMHQKNTPYMDGVPHISQCPISPHSTFRYTFRADNAGTHFWHSHTGMQRGDGLFGALIVRKPKERETHRKLYDFDLPEHIILVQDWAHMLGISMFVAHHHSVGDNKPRNLLINGKGRYFQKIFEEKQKNHQSSTENIAELMTTMTGQLSFTGKGDEEETTVKLSKQDYETYDIVNKNNSIAKEKMMKIATHRIRRQTTFSSSIFDVPPEKMPLARFNVKRGFRYRFRVINAEFLNCPITISIDNHTLIVINSDGYDLEAREVSSVVTYAGERFDFILNATARDRGRNYWIRFKGLMDCDERFEAAHQVAILHYVDGDDDKDDDSDSTTNKDEEEEEEEPIESVDYNFSPGGIEMNVMNKGPGYSDSLTIAELSATPEDDNTNGVELGILQQSEADYKFFIYYDFYPKDHPEFYLSNLYGFNASMSHYTKLFIPQLNHILLKFPSLALLPSKDDLNDSMFCNETSLAAQGIDCRKEFCKCHHVLQVPLDSVVELIIVDEGVTYDANHPFHLHGNAFRVIGLERIGANVTIEQIKALDAAGRLHRNFNRPPIKDTVTIPDGGYTIIRFRAYNPGYWLFHCHIEFHAEIGMALILKVGENSEMLPKPKNFPTCGNFLPDEEDEEDKNEVNDVKKQFVGNSSVLHQISIRNLVLNLLVVAFSISLG